jgi:phosphoribosylanthranilate isomerase
LNPIFIKVCGMKQPQNIADVLSLHPQMMGFIFYPKSSRFVDDTTLTAVKNLPFDSTQKVGVFVDESAQTITQIAQQWGLNVLQLHGNETPELAQKLRENYTVIKALGIETTNDLQQITHFKNHCDYILLDKKSPQHGGTGKAFDWQLLNNQNFDVPIILSGGVSLDNVMHINNIKCPNLVGIDVNSCFETQPALKNMAKLQTLFELLPILHP